MCHFQRFESSCYNVQNNKMLAINNNNRPPSLVDSSQSDGKQGILLCWPSRVEI